MSERRMGQECSLVTGGAGAIGSNLIRALLARNHRVIVVDNLISGKRWNLPMNDAISFIEGDVRSDEVLEAAFRLSPTVVFHLAAFFANQNSIDHPSEDLMVNGLGTLRLLEWARRHSVRRFVYSSSSCVYGNSTCASFDETLKTQLETPYAITKLLGEHYVLFYHKYYGLPAVVLRYFNSYGPGEVPGKYRNVIPNFIYRALRGEPLTVLGTGEETRAFTYVSDVVAGTIRATECDAAVGEILNLGSEVEVKIADLAELINRKCGNPAPIQLGALRSWDQTKRRRPNIQKAREILGFEPVMDIDTGIEATAEWVRGNMTSIATEMSKGTIL